MVSISPVFTSILQQPYKNTKNPNTPSFNSNKDLVSFTKSSNAILAFKGSDLSHLTVDSLSEIMLDPRSLADKANQMRSKLGGQYYDWIYKQYPSIYSEYVQKLVKDTNTTVEDLIKHRPDWTPDTLEQKFKQLHPSESFRFGEVPQSFGTTEDFHLLTDTVNSIVSEEYRKNPFKKDIDIPDIEVGNNTYKIKPFTGGKTGKKVLLLENQHGDKFVLKTDPNFNPYVNRLESCDSVGLQSIIDYYMTANNCENCCKMYYYDEKRNAALYEYVHPDNEQNTVRDAIRYNKFYSHLQDLTNLGIRHNDTVGDSNIIQRQGKFVLVDSGHATFDCSLKPKISGYHRELPNNMMFQFFR